jgi:hypothetical protein
MPQKAGVFDVMSVYKAGSSSDASVALFGSRTGRLVVSRPKRKYNCQSSAVGRRVKKISQSEPRFIPLLVLGTLTFTEMQRPTRMHACMQTGRAEADVGMIWRGSSCIRGAQV